MRNQWAWEKGGDGFTLAERRVHDALRQTRDDLLSGQQAAQASRERISKNIQEATAQLERMQASSAIAARQVSAEISEGMMAVANGIARLGGKIDALSNLIDVRLSELIQAVDSGFGKVSLQLAEISGQLGQIIELAKNPNQTNCAELTRDGMLLYHHAEWDKAKNRFELAISKFASFPAPWLYLGKIALYVEGELASADALFAETAVYGKLKADDFSYAADALIERANIAFLNGDKMKCAEFARLAIDIRRDNVSILVHAARCFIAAGELRSAERSLIAAFDIEPRTVLALALPWAEPVRGPLFQWLKKIHQEDFSMLSAFSAEFREVREIVKKSNLSGQEWKKYDVTEQLLGRMGDGFLDLRLNSKDYLAQLMRAAQAIGNEMREQISSVTNAYETYRYNGLIIGVNTLFRVVISGIILLGFVNPSLVANFPEKGLQGLEAFGYALVIMFMYLMYITFFSIVLSIVAKIIAAVLSFDAELLDLYNYSLVLSVIGAFVLHWLQKAGLSEHLILVFGLAGLAALFVAFWFGRVDAAAKKDERRRAADRVGNILDPLIAKLLELSGRKAAQLENALSQRSRERLVSARYSDSVWVHFRLLPRAVLSFFRVGRQNLTAR